MEFNDGKNSTYNTLRIITVAKENITPTNSPYVTSNNTVDRKVTSQMHWKYFVAISTKENVYALNKNNV